jgi:hypothetical protein
MFFHEVEPLLVIVAALIKLCQFFFHVTPKFLSRWKRRLIRSAHRVPASAKRRRPRQQPEQVRASPDPSR